jgi:glycosyltransferase involved in cell wall biosynthesis
VHYGGIERIVDLLVVELQCRGHDVVLFANPASSTSAKLVSYPRLKSTSKIDTVLNTQFVYKQLAQLGSVDVVHSFARLAYLLPILPKSLPKIQSYQRFISPRSVKLGRYLSRGTLAFTSCSAANASSVRHLARWHIIYNGVQTSKYDPCLSVASNAPLVYLGRIERIKGVHTAIAIALKTGNDLIIAGNIATSGPEAIYFDEEVKPYCDGKQIQYVGPVNDSEKSELLRQAKGMLFPIQWEEPFGIVMAESLACGTPVIGFARGAVPEVVEHGVTGFVCHSFDEMVDSVSKLPSIDRAACRRSVEERFSERVIVDGYESLYYHLVEKQKR